MSSKQDKQGLRVGILVLVIIACVWLAPTGSGLAASGASDFSVKVIVEDSLSVNMNHGVFQLLDTDLTGGDFFKMNTGSSAMTTTVASNSGSHGDTSEFVVTISKL